MQQRRSGQQQTASSEVNVGSLGFWKLISSESFDFAEAADPDEAEALSLFQSGGGGSIGPEASHHRRPFPPACIQSKLPNPPRLVLFVLAELLYTKGMDRVSFSQLYIYKKKKWLLANVAVEKSHVPPPTSQRL